MGQNSNYIRKGTNFFQILLSLPCDYRKRCLQRILGKKLRIP